MQFRPTNIDLFRLLPPYFLNILDFSELMNTENIELKEFQVNFTRGYDNLFIQTADSDTLEYHEELLGLAVNPDDDLETRRVRILDRYQLTIPYTNPLLREYLNKYIGLDSWTYEENISGYFINIAIFSDSVTDILNTRMLILEMVPAHIDTLITIDDGYFFESDIFYGAAIYVDVQQSMYFDIEIPELKYKVYYHPGAPDATGTVTDNNEYDYNQQVTILDNGFIRDNYMFEGWSTEQGFPAVYFPGDIIDMPPNDLNLYAAWNEAFQVNVTYTAQPVGLVTGTTIDPNSPYYTGDEITILENGFTHTDPREVFIGWSLDDDGSTVEYLPGQVVIAGIYDIPLYPVWQIPTYRVLYNPNAEDATGDVEDLDRYEAYAPFTVQENGFDRIGYRFVGWNDTEDGTGEWYVPGAIVPMPEGGITLYAIWGEAEGDALYIRQNNAPIIPPTVIDYIKETNPAFQYTPQGQVAISPEGNYLAVSTTSTAARIMIFKYNGTSWDRITTVSGLPTTSVGQMAFSSNGEYLAFLDSSISSTPIRMLKRDDSDVYTAYNATFGDLNTASFYYFIKISNDGRKIFVVWENSSIEGIGSARYYFDTEGNGTYRSSPRIGLQGTPTGCAMDGYGIHCMMKLTNVSAYNHWVFYYDTVSGGIKYKVINTQEHVGINEKIDLSNDGESLVYGVQGNLIIRTGLEYPLGKSWEISGDLPPELPGIDFSNSIVRTLQLGGSTAYTYAVAVADNAASILWTGSQSPNLFLYKRDEPTLNNYSIIPTPAGVPSGSVQSPTISANGSRLAFAFASGTNDNRVSILRANMENVLYPARMIKYSKNGRFKVIVRRADYGTDMLEVLERTSEGYTTPWNVQSVQSGTISNVILTQAGFGMVILYDTLTSYPNNTRGLAAFYRASNATDDYDNNHTFIFISSQAMSIPKTGISDLLTQTYYIGGPGESTASSGIYSSIRVDLNPQKPRFNTTSTAMQYGIDLTPDSALGMWDNSSGNTPMKILRSIVRDNQVYNSNTAFPPTPGTDSIGIKVLEVYKGFMIVLRILQDAPYLEAYFVYNNSTTGYNYGPVPIDTNPIDSQIIDIVVSSDNRFVGLLTSVQEQKLVVYEVTGSISNSNMLVLVNNSKLVNELPEVSAGKLYGIDITDGGNALTIAHNNNATLTEYVKDNDIISLTYDKIDAKDIYNPNNNIIQTFELCPDTNRLLVVYKDEPAIYEYMFTNLNGVVWEIIGTPIVTDFVPTHLYPGKEARNIIAKRFVPGEDNLLYLKVYSRFPTDINAYPGLDAELYVDDITHEGTLIYDADNTGQIVVQRHRNEGTGGASWKYWGGTETHYALDRFVDITTNPYFNSSTGLGMSGSGVPFMYTTTMDGRYIYHLYFTSSSSGSINISKIEFMYNDTVTYPTPIVKRFELIQVASMPNYGAGTSGELYKAMIMSEIQNYILIAFNASGTTQSGLIIVNPNDVSDKSYPTLYTSLINIYAMDNTPDGRHVYVAYSNAPYLCRLTIEGRDIVNQELLTGLVTQPPTKLRVTSDGNYIICGYDNSTDLDIIKINYNYNITGGA